MNCTTDANLEFLMLTGILIINNISCSYTVTRHWLYMYLPEKTLILSQKDYSKNVFFREMNVWSVPCTAVVIR